MCRKLRGPIEWAMMVALVFGAGALAQAQDEESQPQGRIIQISPDDGQEQATPDRAGRGPRAFQPGFREEPVEAPRYWIGLLGGPVTPELRAHLDVPEEEGVLVREVVPESPAEEAGLKVYDVLLTANDAPLRDMRDLVELVRIEGERQGQITLEVLRHGHRETVWVAPEERPEQMSRPRRDFGFGERGWGGPGPQGAEDLWQWFGERGGPQFDFRQFGPGEVPILPFGRENLPQGLSVQVHKEGDQPARITVQRDGETWEVVGDDPESLDQLPDDVRPFVERMLRGGAPLGRFEMPDFGGGLAVPPGLHDQSLRDQLNAMERQLQILQERLFGEGEEPADDAR